MAVMTDISVEPGDDAMFRVEVRSGTRTTSHEVTVPPGYARTLGCELVRTEQLVERSFEFLLEREPPTSILRRFSLDVIADYFPEYPTEIRGRCAPGGG